MKSETPKIRGARAGRGRDLWVVWKGGVEIVVNLSAFLESYVVFEPLRAGEAFQSVSVGEWGWSVDWSDDMEIASDTLWRLSLEQGAAWLRSWRLDHDMTQSEAAAAVGIGPRMWRYYEAGEHPLPKTIRLACAGLHAQERAA